MKKFKIILIIVVILSAVWYYFSLKKKVTSAISIDPQAQDPVAIVADKINSVSNKIREAFPQTQDDVQPYIDEANAKIQELQQIRDVFEQASAAAETQKKLLISDYVTPLEPKPDNFVRIATPINNVVKDTYLMAPTPIENTTLVSRNESFSLVGRESYVSQLSEAI